jgi:hypothetical protein
VAASASQMSFVFGTKTGWIVVAGSRRSGVDRDYSCAGKSDDLTRMFADGDIDLGRIALDGIFFRARDIIV